MKFRILVQWPSEDILPTEVALDTATAALGRYRSLVNASIAGVQIHAFDTKGSSRISARRLVALARAERLPSKSSKGRVRQTIASALLGMIASALPNGFGDFGVLSGQGPLHAGRTTRSRGYRSAG